MSYRFVPISLLVILITVDLRSREMLTLRSTLSTLFMGFRYIFIHFSE